MDQDYIVKYCSTLYETFRELLIVMFEAERKICNENDVDEDIIIDLNDTNNVEVPNLDYLKIEEDKLPKIDAIEVDKDILNARVMNEYKRNYNKFEKLIKGQVLRMAEHIISELRAMLNRMSELNIGAYQNILYT